MAFKIYTRKGDKGETSLFGGDRLPKDDLRIEAYGTLDELNAQLGLLGDLLAAEGQNDLRTAIVSLQNLLFNMGSLLATAPHKKAPVPALTLQDVSSLEKAIDEMDEQLPALKNFILPGGHMAVSTCHLARCVCRRAERLVVRLARESKVPDFVLEYLNRLSDYLFVLARLLAKRLEVEEVIWSPRS